MKPIFLIAIAIYIFFSVFLFFKNDKANLKIEIKTTYKSPKEIDEIIAQNIENIILNINEVKEAIFISSKYGLNIYIKFKFFSKKDTRNIQRNIEPFLKNINFVEKVFYDENYNKKYVYLIITSKNDNYYELKNLSDVVLEELLNSKIKNIKILGLKQKAIYIYFSNNDLQNFNITVEDIKDLIKKNNLTKNYFNKNYSQFKTTIKTNSSISTIEDIENIVFKYQDENFSTKLKDIFKIEEKIKTPSNEEIFYNDKKAIIFAIPSANYIKLLRIKNKFKKENITIINPLFLNKTEILENNNLNIENLVKKYSSIKNNTHFCISFIGKNPYGYSKFDENIENKITLFSNKNFKQNNKKNEKAEEIIYEINKQKLSQQDIKKSEIINVIQTGNDGLICDYFWDKKEKIEIILKNKDNSELIYSKKYKNFIDINYFLDSKIESNKNIYFRKNHKIQNPPYI